MQSVFSAKTRKSSKIYVVTKNRTTLRYYNTHADDNRGSKALMLSAHVEQKLYSVLTTIYFISAPHVRTALVAYVCLSVFVYMITQKMIPKCSNSEQGSFVFELSCEQTDRQTDRIIHRQTRMIALLVRLASAWVTISIKFCLVLFGSVPQCFQSCWLLSLHVYTLWTIKRLISWSQLWNILIDFYNFCIDISRKFCNLCVKHFLLLTTVQKL